MTDDSSADGPVLTRRRALKAAGLAGAGALLPIAATTSDAATERAPGGADWAQYQVDAGNSAYLPDGTAPTADPTERWRFRNDRYHDGVAIVDDTVYVGGKSLAAVTLASGEKRWEYAPEGSEEYWGAEGNTPEFGMPAVADGTVYVDLGWGVYDGGTSDQVLAAVDAASGAEQWWFDPDGYGEYSTPVVADGTVYTYANATGDGNSEAVVFALAPDGSVRWQQAVDDQGGYGPVAVADGSVYAHTASGVAVLDAATGEEQQRLLPDVDVTEEPLVHDGRLYVGEYADPGVTVVALDAATGEEHWRTAYDPEGDSDLLSIEAADDDTLYVQIDDNGAAVTALDAATGEEQWQTSLDYEPPPDYYTDEVGRVGDYLYAGSVCIDPADGSVVWRHGLGVTASGWWLGAAAQGVAIVIGTEVVALEGPTGGGTTETTTETTTQDGTTETETTTSETDTTTETTGTTTRSESTTQSGTTRSTTTTTTESGDCDL